MLNFYFCHWRMFSGQAHPINAASQWLIVISNFSSQHHVGIHAFVPACLCMHRHFRVRVCSCAHNRTSCDGGTSLTVIMHLLRKCCQIVLAPPPRGARVRREEMSVREWNACVHYAYEPLPRSPATPHAYMS